MNSFREISKNHTFWHLIPRLRFFKIPAVTLFYFIDPQLHAKFKKTNKQSLRYQKTGRQADRRTDRPANKGDHHGPPQVKTGAKMETYII